MRIVFTLLLFSISLFAGDFKLITPPVLQLGTIQSDTIATGTIKFTNDGDSDMNISEVQTSCGCTMAEMEKMNYKPGESGQIEVHFNSKGYSGRVRKTVTIYVEGDESFGHRIVLEAQIQPILDVAPSFLDFQDLKMEQGESRNTFTITNNMQKEMTVERILPDIKYLTVKPAHFNLKPGESQVVEVFYQPHKIGRESAMIAVQVTAPKKLEKRLPVFIQVAP